MSAISSNIGNSQQRRPNPNKPPQRNQVLGLESSPTPDPYPFQPQQFQAATQQEPISRNKNSDMRNSGNDPASYASTRNLISDEPREGSGTKFKNAAEETVGHLLWSQGVSPQPYEESHSKSNYHYHYITLNCYANLHFMVKVSKKMAGHKTKF